MRARILLLVLFSLAAVPLGSQWQEAAERRVSAHRRRQDRYVRSRAAQGGRQARPFGYLAGRQHQVPGELAADFKPEELPIQPWAEALTKERSTETHGAEESDARCLPPGIPKINSTPNPFKIVQEPKLVVVLYESMGIYRQFFLDGRKPRKDADPTWEGYSVAKWDGDTLVVDSTGFNGKFWLDKKGHPATESLHVTERFRRPDFGHLEIQSTIDDPKAYTKPWSSTQRFELTPNTELFEAVCENEQDIKHMPGK